MAEHGTRSRYNDRKNPCSCQDCRFASAAYIRAYRTEQRRLALLGKEVERLVKNHPRTERSN